MPWEDIIVLPKIMNMKIKNIGCVGSAGIDLDIDDIVVLVGPNNTGKSTILKVYQCIMGNGKLDVSDFHWWNFDPNNPPEVEVISFLSNDTTIPVWGHFRDPQQNNWFQIKEKRIFDAQGKWHRKGWNYQTNIWENNGPLGSDNVAKPLRPIPIMVSAFDSPEKQTQEINKLLKQLLIEQLRNITDENQQNLYNQLVESIKNFQARIKDETQEAITSAEQDLSRYISSIFPYHELFFDVQAESISEDKIPFFSSAELKVKGSDGYNSTIDKQGSGARRTILWSILKYINSQSGGQNRSFVLLIDEPELCLHPNAIRGACKVLYDLASQSWRQVMITTHSPQFIDLSRNNTTIIRVERDGDHNVWSTILYRPETVQLTDDDKENLKLLNLFDPYVAEFFFGWKVIVVEWDTEYSVFKYICNNEWYSDVHIIRARGKSTIVSLMKILNHFWCNYSVLHDTDLMNIQREGREGRNPAWTVNEHILATKNNNVKLIASKVTFETAYFGENIKKDKPYHAITKIREDQDLYDKLKQLLDYLIWNEVDLPDWAIERDNIQNLTDFIN